MKAIYKRELNSYFHSMLGYVFVAFLTAITGIYFMAYNLNIGYPYFAYTLSGMLFILMIAVPVLTMRCFAEERKSKTDQLLLTSPVSLLQIVLGKYLAMVTVFAVPNLIFCIYPLIIKTQGTAYLAVDYSAIWVFFLLGCVYIAIGMFLSSLTESQIIAAVSTFAVLIVLYLMQGLLQFLPTTAIGGAVGLVLILTLVVFFIYRMTRNWMLSAAIEAAGIIACVITYVAKSSFFEGILSTLFGKLVLDDVFTNISSNHLLDVSGLILFVTLIAVFVFLTMQTIQKRRWS